MSLTSGSVSCILNGDDVSEAVVQILDYDGDHERGYKILISDGDVSSHVFLDEQLNSLITNEELQIYTIIQVNKCVWDYENDETFIKLKEITVLNHSSLIMRTLGNPIYASAKSRNSTEEIATDPDNTDISKIAIVSNEEPNSLKSLLTAGSVSRILNEDDVSKATVQVICYDMKDESVYKIVISDGDYCSHVFLNKQYNSLITNKKLEMCSIIQVNKCSWEYNADEKFVTLQDITVLIHASLIGDILGNPIYISAKSRDATEETTTDPNSTAVSQIATDTSQASNSNMSLTSGSVWRIFNGDDASKAVVQVLDCDGDGEHEYEILISDGDISSHVFLNKQFNNLIINEKLEIYAIIQVNKSNLVPDSDEPYILLQDITVLIQGSVIRRTLGNPTQIRLKPRDASKETATDPNSTDIPQIARVTSEEQVSVLEVLLAEKAINRILNGEDVSGAVLQVIGYVKGIPRDSYSVLISDGDFSAYALLDTQLSSLITNKRLKTFSLIEVRKYVCINNRNSKIIRLVDITVLVPAAEVGTILKNPINVLKFSRDASERDALQSESPSTSQMVTSQETEKDIATKLTLGSVSRILNENYVTRVVVQVLNYEKACGPEEYYLINISDGCFSSNVYLDMQLNSLITNRELDMFSIIRVDESASIAKGNLAVKAIVNLTVLTLGIEIGKILGNPVNLSTSAKDAAIGRGTDTQNTEISEMVTNIDPKLSMLTETIESSIERILSGKILHEKVAMQVLGYVKVTLDGDMEKHWYRLHISDGVYFYSFAVLHKKLHSLIINHHLERFTKISVDDWVCQPHTTGHEIIFITNLTILVPGAEVGGKLGNPVNYASIPNAHGREMPNTDEPSMLPKLTEDSIKSILNGDEVHAPVMQVLGYNKCSFHEDLENERYLLQVSDGVYYSYVLLHTRINRVVFNRGLEDFTIIRVLKYHCKQEVPGRKIIIITDLAILTPGADVGERLGHPVNYATCATSGTGTGISDTHQRIALPKLTTGSFTRIYNGDHVPEPVVQVLNCKRMSGTEDYWYQIIIYDGHHTCPFAKLDTKLSRFVNDKKLEKFTIIRLDKYEYIREPGARMIHLLDITILNTGTDVGQKLKSF